MGFEPTRGCPRPASNRIPSPIGSPFLQMPHRAKTCHHASPFLHEHPDQDSNPEYPGRSGV